MGIISISKGKQAEKGAPEGGARLQEGAAGSPAGGAAMECGACAAMPPGFVRAVYVPTGEKCFVNPEYVVDAFVKDGAVEMYTVNEDRGAYRVSMEDFSGMFL